jgi:hypothetical protein
MSEKVNAVEAVAKAFYELQEDARGWEREPEFLKEPFRDYARAAIALIRQTEDRRETTASLNL